MIDIPVYSANWSDEDNEYVGLCNRYPSLSWCAPTSREALDGIKQLVRKVEADLAKDTEIRDTEIRECPCGREFEVVIKYARPWTVCPDCMIQDTANG